MANLTRRGFTTALALSPWALGWGGVLPLPLPVQAATPPYRVRRLLMGTWVDITVAEGQTQRALDATEAAFAAMARSAGVMSRFDEMSALSEINRAAGRHAVTVPRELLHMLGTAQRLQRATAGAFDATLGRLTHIDSAAALPDAGLVQKTLQAAGTQHLRMDAARSSAYLDDALFELDLGGVAKLPILNLGLQTLAQHGVRGALVNGGGDVLASPRADGLAWRIGVRDPAEADQLLGVLPLRAGVVASSGDYERFITRAGQRYHHIIDPATGRPTRGVRGVTLVADHVATVNGLGLAAMVAGSLHGPQLLQRLGVTQAVMVGDDGRAWVSAALAKHLQTAPGREARLSPRARTTG